MAQLSAHMSQGRPKHCQTTDTYAALRGRVGCGLEEDPASCLQGKREMAVSKLSGPLL